MRSSSRSMQGMAGKMKTLCGRIRSTGKRLKTGTSDAFLTRSLRSQEEQLFSLAEVMRVAAQVLEESADLYDRYDMQIAEQPLPTEGGWIVRQIDLRPVRDLAGNLGEIRF